MHIGLAIWPAENREWFELGLGARPDIRCSPLHQPTQLPPTPVNALLIDGDSPGPSFVNAYRALVQRDSLLPMLVMGSPDCPALMAVEWDPNLTLFLPKPVQIESTIEHLIRYASPKPATPRNTTPKEAPPRKSMGYLSTLHVSDLLQMLCQGGWSGRLGVTHLTGGEHGDFFIERGAITHAAQDNLSGLDACYRILAWPRAEFVFDESATLPTPTIRESWQEILLEGARRIDTGHTPHPQVDVTRLPDKLFG